MPRLTNSDYLKRHYWLQEIHQSHPEVFGVLPVKLQQSLHNYYQTAALLSEDELIATRTHLQHGSPSLAQVASKAFKRLRIAAEVAEKRSKGDPKTYRQIVSYLTPTHDTSRITVAGRLRPQLDIDSLALVMIEFVNKMSPEEWKGMIKEGKELLDTTEKSSTAGPK